MMAYRKTADKMITETHIQRKLYTHLQNSSQLLCPNVYIGRWEADLLQVTKSGYLREFEIKISRSDLKNDAKKDALYATGKETVTLYNGHPFERAVYGKRTKYDVLQAGERVTEFYYVVPEGMVKPSDLPDWAGLWWVGEHITQYGTRHYTLIEVRRAKRLNRVTVSEKVKAEMLKSCYYRYWRLWLEKRRPKKTARHRAQNENQLQLSIEP